MSQRRELPLKRRIDLLTLRLQGRLDSEGADRVLPWAFFVGLFALLAGFALARARGLVQDGLPDGSGLLLTHLLYLTPGEAIINEKGLTPDIAVEQPDVEFGRPLPTTDATLDKAIEQLKSK